MKNILNHQTSSFIAAIVFAVVLVFQTIFRTKAWPIEYFVVVPGFIGDMLTFIFWIGAAPLAISFFFLIPVKPIKVAAILAVGFTLVICLVNPLSNLVYTFLDSGRSLQIKTLALNIFSLLICSGALFISLVLIPKMVIYLFNQRK
jgi:hypothetical protein